MKQWCYTRRCNVWCGLWTQTYCIVHMNFVLTHQEMCSLFSFLTQWNTKLLKALTHSYRAQQSAKSQNSKASFQNSGAKKKKSIVQLTVNKCQRQPDPLRPNLVHSDGTPSIYLVCLFMHVWPCLRNILILDKRHPALFTHSECPMEDHLILSDFV